MYKLLIKITGLLLFFSSCVDKSGKEENKQTTDVAVNLKIDEQDYENYFVSDKIDLNKLKNDLTEFREHLDYKDTLYVDLYEFNNHYLVILPKDFTVGQTTFLASWINYGFCLSKHKSNSDKDLFFYTDENIIKQDFIAGVYRDNSVSFKVDMVHSSFQGINSTSFEYGGNTDLITKLKGIMFSNFKLSDARIIEKKFILKKFEGFEPYVDSTKSQDKSVHV